MTEKHYAFEEKDRLAGCFSPETAQSLRYLLSESRFQVLKASFWHCRSQWTIPERRISDNLVLTVESGCIEVAVDGNCTTLKRGEGAIIPERVPHRYRLAEGCGNASLFILHAMPVSAVVDNLFCWLDSPFYHTADPELLLKRLRRCVAMRQIDNECAMTDARRILNELLLEFAENGSFRCRERAAGDVRIAEACRFFSTHLAENISVVDAAEKINLREAQFRRIFKAETGLSPNEYLHRARLQHAVRLLLRYPMRIDEVAAASGFRSATYFCSSFLRAFGQSPNQFRQSCR